ncbi:hypothetical protein Zmor_015500 [Zophobas morio]|uniref:Peptidase S1 domain-containing protein n=1 Tax=Zophobas morio TaxID=2755281 RepID=A0AA38MGJ6_9CUCU|nr:hypothetical protein Zmor_015500 [Zophobas morio]
MNFKCTRNIWLPFLLIFTIFNTKISGKEVRIIGGNESFVGDYPFAAAIYVETEDGKYFCGGSIYNQNWAITSGNCVYKAVLFTIQVGSVHLEGHDPNRQTVATSEYVIHPDFNPDTMENDIGLIRFRMPITYTQYVQPVYLPFRVIGDGESAISIGWGQTSDSDAEFSTTLKYVSVVSLSNQECKITYGNQITDNMICAAGNYNEGTCVGDNGSPLLEFYMYRFHYIVGIASFISGNGCESTDPSGYTRVFPYVDWIRNVTSA